MSTHNTHQELLDAVVEAATAVRKAEDDKLKATTAVEEVLCDMHPDLMLRGAAGGAQQRISKSTGYPPHQLRRIRKTIQSVREVTGKPIRTYTEEEAEKLFPKVKKELAKAEARVEKARRAWNTAVATFLTSPVIKADHRREDLDIQLREAIREEDRWAVYTSDRSLSNIIASHRNPDNTDQDLEAEAVKKGGHASIKEARNAAYACYLRFLEGELKPVREP